MSTLRKLQTSRMERAVAIFLHVQTARPACTFRDTHVHTELPTFVTNGCYATIKGKTIHLKNTILVTVNLIPLMIIQWWIKQIR